MFFSVCIVFFYTIRYLNRSENCIAEFEFGSLFVSMGICLNLITFGFLQKTINLTSVLCKCWDIIIKNSMPFFSYVLCRRKSPEGFLFVFLYDILPTEEIWGSDS